MPQPPSIKGSVFGSHAAELLKLVANGKIARDELVRRLEPGDIEILEGKIQTTQWYDIRLYERVMLLRRDVEGDGSNDCLLRYGRESAERLLQSGVYQQLDYLGRTQHKKESDAGARFQAFGRDLRLLTSLTSSLLNFAPQRVNVDPEFSDRYVLEHIDARAYPEVLCWTHQGFMNRMAAEHGEPDLWRWERPEPDRVVYRMTRSL